MFVAECSSLNQNSGDAFGISPQISKANFAHAPPPEILLLVLNAH